MNLFRRSKTVKVISAKLNTINDLATRGHGAEIGGLLLGHWDNSDIIIDQVVEVNDPNATYSSWLRDEKRAQRVLEGVRKMDEDNLRGYVGDWHTHPEMIKASYTDIISLKQASRQYKQPLVMIVRLPDGSFDAHAAINGKLLKVEFIS